MKLTELGKTIIICILFWVFVFVFIVCCTGCGGTFTYGSPVGPISYTTPQLIKPKVQNEK